MKSLLDCTAMSECMYEYHEHALASEQVRAVEAHLRNCPDCREAATKIGTVREIMRASAADGALKPSHDLMRITEERLTTRASLDRTGGEEGEDCSVPAPALGILDDLRARMGAAPWWLISGAFHALVLMLVTLIGLAVMRGQKEDVVIVTDLEKVEPEEIEELKERDILKKPVPIVDSEIITDELPIVTHDEVEIAEQVETENDSDAADTLGEDGLSDVWLGGSGTVAAIGLGGGGGGAFGRPGPGGRMRRAIINGGDRATESAVDLALQWLAKHQEPEGRWAILKHEGGRHNGKESCDVGVTGLALLAFLGAGHTEKIGRYKSTVRKAIRWLISKQDGEGAIGLNSNWKGWENGSGYNHPIAGMALAEAFAMGRNPAVGTAAQKAIDYATRVHYNAKRGAWRYAKPAVCESKGGAVLSPVGISVTGWFVMQLKSARVAGLEFDHQKYFQGVSKFLDEHMVGGAGGNDGGYGGHRYIYDKGALWGSDPNYCNTSIGLVCRLFMGTPPQEISRGVRYMLEHPPSWDPKNGLGPKRKISFPHYYWYYGTLACFQAGGNAWRQWNAALKATLVPTQRKDGDFNGSWDPIGYDGTVAGRAYSTAMGALCLEVYYRYLPMYRE